MADELKIKIGVELDFNNESKTQFDSFLRDIKKEIPPIKIAFKVDADPLKQVSSQLKEIESRAASLEKKFSNTFSKLNSSFSPKAPTRQKSSDDNTFNNNDLKWLEKQQQALEKIKYSVNSTKDKSGFEGQLDNINKKYSEINSLINTRINSTEKLTTVQKVQIEAELSSIRGMNKSYQKSGNFSDSQIKSLFSDLNTGKIESIFAKTKKNFENLGDYVDDAGRQKFSALQEKYNSLISKSGSLDGNSSNKKQQDLAKEISQTKELTKACQAYIDTKKQKKSSDDNTQVQLGRLKKMSNELRNYLELNDRISNNRSVQIRGAGLLNQLDQAIGSGGQVALEKVQALDKEIAEFKGKVKDLGLEGQTFGSKLSAQMSKLGVYFSAASIMMGAWSQVKNTIDNVIKLDSVVTDLQVATGKTRDETKELLNSYSEMGKVVGSTTAQVAESADDWLRQGKSIEESNKLTKDSLMLSKLGKIAPDEATTALTTASKSYKVAVEDMTSIVDKFVSVDMESATTAGGLAKSLQETAVSAQLAGISLDKMIGYIAVVSEISGDAPESVGNFYKSFLSRMSSIKEGRMIDPDTGDDLSTVETVLHNIGIKLRDDKDQFRNFGTVLDEIAVKWVELGKAGDNVGQSKIASALGLTRQQEKAKILFEHYDEALKYADIAANSLGSAEQKFNDAYLNSTEASMNQFTAQYEQLSNTIWSSNIVSGTFDAGTGVLGFLTGIVDKVSALPPLFTAAITAASLFSNKGRLLQVQVFQNITICPFVAAGDGERVNNRYGVVNKSYICKLNFKWCA